MLSVRDCEFADFRIANTELRLKIGTSSVDKRDYE